jgi:hypothetical protein
MTLGTPVPEGRMRDLFYAEEEPVEHPLGHVRCTPETLLAFVQSLDHSPTMGELRHEFGGIIGAMIHGHELKRKGLLPPDKPRSPRGPVFWPEPSPVQPLYRRRIVDDAGNVLASGMDVEALHAEARRLGGVSVEWEKDGRWTRYLTIRPHEGGSLFPNPEGDRK